MGPIGPYGDPLWRHMLHISQYMANVLVPSISVGSPVTSKRREEGPREEDPPRPPPPRPDDAEPPPQPDEGASHTRGGGTQGLGRACRARGSGGLPVKHWTH